MYSDKKNVGILISLLKKYGIRNFVISPGSRNMAIVKSVEDDPFFNCYSVVDERSAGYFAIGLNLEKREPVVLSCTSAQATRNYIPAMTEAFYRGTPLVVVTADYKDSLIGQGTMQAIDQTLLPRDTHKYSVKLPECNTVDEEKYCARLVNEALLELDHHGTGPVHIDIPVDELWSGGVNELPKTKKIDRFTELKDLPSLEGKKILITIGEHHPFTKQQTESLEKFSEKYSAPIYVNHLSNYPGKNAFNVNLAITRMDAKIFEGYKPDILITIGEQIGDYSIDTRLKQVPSYDHWRVNLDGKIVDTYGRLTKVFECSEEDFFNVYNSQKTKKANKSYLNKWQELVSNRVIPDNLPLSHAFVAKTLAPKIPKGSSIHFAILSSFRNWCLFDLDKSIKGYSNVAGYGIDGCLSTFMGHSVAADDKTFLIIGDLSFFYDMNAMGIRHIKNNARVVLVNNRGGGEFRLFSHAASEFGEKTNRHISAYGHNGSAKGWAESVGWEYIPVKNKQDLVDSVDRFVGDSDKPILMEVFTTMEDDSDGVKIMQKANTKKSLKGKVTSSVPPKLKRKIKKIIKR